MKEKIESLIRNAIKEVYGLDFPDTCVNHRRNEKSGWISPVCFKLAGVVKDSPVIAAKKLIPYLKNDQIGLVMQDQGYLVIYEP